VVIPVIDEANALRPLLADLNAQRGVALECIVADGGSVDASDSIARAAGATLVVAPPGRGVQMNAGARAAGGDWLCFLHADSRLTHPDQLRAGLERLAAAGERRVAGHFALRFIRTKTGHRLFYRYLEAKTGTDRRYTINGDQGLLLHRDFFAALGGFDERQAFLEDQRLAAAVASHGRWCLLPHRLATSARRFEVEGAAARYLLMALIMAMYIVDVPAFFARAPSVYARQSETGRLILMPYFRLLRRLLHDCGMRRSLKSGWRIAGVALAQTWQISFVLDVMTGHARSAPVTRFYERYLRAGIEQPLSQGLLLVVFSFAIFGPLQLWCALREFIGY
jgi:rSAM/selenodomain-associated transferase 2